MLTSQIKYKKCGDALPFPYIDLKVSNAFGENPKQKMGQIDTGASLTVIPKNLIKSLNLGHIGKVNVRGFDGSVVKCDTYWVNIKINNTMYKNIQVLATSGLDILIGRNLINSWQMKLDGKTCTGELRHDP